MKRPPTSPVPRGMVYECVLASCGCCGQRHMCERARVAPEGLAEVAALGWQRSAEYGLVCADCHAAALALGKRRRHYARSLADGAAS